MSPYKVLVSTKDLDRQEWLKYRRQGIGGSDAAAICGLSPYSSAFQVYLDKIGEAPEKEDSECMRQGRDLEAYVASRCEEKEGLKTRRKNAMLQSIEHPFMLADVDRLIEGKNEGLECKTTSIFNNGALEDGVIPTQYQMQCHHYMAVTGADAWWLAVLVLNKAFYTFRIERDEEIIDNLVAIEKRFWEENVLAKSMPMPDGSKEAGNLIKNMFGEPSDEVLDLSSTYDSDLDRYQEVSELIKGLETEKETIKQRLQLQMGNSSKAITSRYIISCSKYQRESLDSKTLKAEHPDIYSKYLKTSDTQRFSIKLNGGI